MHKLRGGSVRRKKILRQRTKRMNFMMNKLMNGGDDKNENYLSDYRIYGFLYYDNKELVYNV